MKEITPKEIERLVNPNIIDVRETDEVAAGYIPGSVNIPLGLLEFRLHELDKTKEYIIVCRSGARSGRATEFLSSQGFHATNMVGGMMNWEGNVQ
ncbi:rhodanese-like domain-containing protein [Alkalihalobacillus oceani]|uniref:Rhodanese-like domain-containing protein n=1 Tax=Halalkalibacter oceani TaxID=1653776 RepID=A0A9X2DRV8_9BACI|nr:rhodanese-like domain-containing protein [Halalkalibacter oceani]MCM3715899.1 rhodanese-like domain-containing protein [Halalkalibacter oceani]